MDDPCRVKVVERTVADALPVRESAWFAPSWLKGALTFYRLDADLSEVGLLSSSCSPSHSCLFFHLQLALRLDQGPERALIAQGQKSPVASYIQRVEPSEARLEGLRQSLHGLLCLVGTVLAIGGFASNMRRRPVGKGLPPSPVL